MKIDFRDFGSSKLDNLPGMCYHTTTTMMGRVAKPMDLKRAFGRCKKVIRQGEVHP